jgi:hypothetical protein
MPGGAGAVGVLDYRKAVDDAGGGRVSACESLLDAGDSPTASS